MKKAVPLTAVLLILLSCSAFSVPSIQLWIDGATYDSQTQTWVTTESSFDLYVVAHAGVQDVYVSMALEDFSQLDDPNAAGVSVSGVGSYDPWTYGYAPLMNDPDVYDGGGDLATHGIYPAWYSEFQAGSFSNQGLIGDVTQGTTWRPTDGYGANTQTYGEFKKFTISISGSQAVHFDAYTYNSDGTIDEFAPFSHDAATGIPEPTTALLFGLGMAGAGVVRKLRKQKQL